MLTELGSSSESRYRVLFENSPLSLWEEDWSEVKAHFDALQASGTVDFARHFRDHPEDVAHCARLVRVLDVNQVTLRLMRAKDKQELLGDLHRVLLSESQGVFQDELVALAEGQRYFEAESAHANLVGERIDVAIYVRVPPDAAGTLSTVLVSMLDITQRKRTEEALRKERETLRQMLDFQEHERQLIAYEIHDGLAQQLAGAMLMFQAYRDQQGAMEPRAGETFEAAVQLLVDGTAEARRLIGGLRPPQLDEEGIESALGELCRQSQDRWGLKIQFVSHVEEQRLAPTLETAIFRIVQEAIGNARRHSKTDRVRVELAQEGDRLWLDVRDWGIGFDPELVRRGHFGLEGIRERARLLGGHAAWETAPRQGTRLRVELPLLKSTHGEE